MRKKTILVILSVFFILVVSFVLVSIFAKDYRVSKQDSYIAYSGGIDLYHASREELIELDLCKYSEVFGEVKNAKEAAGIAAKVIEKVYGKEESPYIVKLNETANAWIVYGSLPAFHLGGVAAIAIDKETGEIIMLLHTD